MLHKAAQKNGEQAGGHQIHHFDLGDAQHIQAQCRNQQRTDTGHFCDNGIAAQIGSDERGAEGDQALIDQNGRAGKRNADTQRGSKDNRTDAVQQGLGLQGILVSRETVFQRADDGHGAYAEQQAGSHESSAPWAAAASHLHR